MMTNATKANIIAAINAVLACAMLFGLPVSDVQVGGIGIAVNAVLAVFVGLTFKSSPKRLPEGVEKKDVVEVVTESGTEHP
jgi:hypothetical protein